MSESRNPSLNEALTSDQGPGTPLSSRRVYSWWKTYRGQVKEAYQPLATEAYSSFTFYQPKVTPLVRPSASSSQKVKTYPIIHHNYKHSSSGRRKTPKIKGSRKESEKDNHQPLTAEAYNSFTFSQPKVAPLVRPAAARSSQKVKTYSISPYNYKHTNPGREKTPKIKGFRKESGNSTYSMQNTETVVEPVSRTYNYYGTANVDPQSLTSILRMTGSVTPISTPNSVQYYSSNQLYDTQIAVPIMNYGLRLTTIPEQTITPIRHIPQGDFGIIRKIVRPTSRTQKIHRYVTKSKKEKKKHKKPNKEVESTNETEETDLEPEPKPAPKPRPDPVSKPDSDPEPFPEPGPKPLIIPDPEPDPEPNPEPPVMPDPVPADPKPSEETKSEDDSGSGESEKGSDSDHKQKPIEHHKRKPKPLPRRDPVSKPVKIPIGEPFLVPTHRKLKPLPNKDIDTTDPKKDIRKSVDQEKEEKEKSKKSEQSETKKESKNKTEIEKKKSVKKHSSSQEKDKDDEKSEVKKKPNQEEEPTTVVKPDGSKKGNPKIKEEKKTSESGQGSKKKNKLVEQNKEKDEKDERNKKSTKKDSKPKENNQGSKDSAKKTSNAKKESTKKEKDVKDIEIKPETNKSKNDSNAKDDSKENETSKNKDLQGSKKEPNSEKKDKRPLVSENDSDSSNNDQDVESRPHNEKVQEVLPIEVRAELEKTQQILNQRLKHTNKALAAYSNVEHERQRREHLKEETERENMPKTDLHLSVPDMLRCIRRFEKNHVDTITLKLKKESGVEELTVVRYDPKKNPAKKNVYKEEVKQKDSAGMETGEVEEPEDEYLEEHVSDLDEEDDDDE